MSWEKKNLFVVCLDHGGFSSIVGGYVCTKRSPSIHRSYSTQPKNGWEWVKGHCEKSRVFFAAICWFCLFAIQKVFSFFFCNFNFPIFSYLHIIG